MLIVVGLANHTLLIAKDGTETPIDDSAAPIRHADGRLFGVVLVFRDFSIRRLAEEQLQQANRCKDEFLAILSHELRNPLAPIRMAVAMLQKVGPPDPELKELRDIIDRQTTQLTRLLDDLLDVSRIASGKIVLRKDRASLGLAVSIAVESARPQIDSQRHELIVNVPPEPIYIEGDMTRLAQVIANLLNNAAKYTPKGGRITLTVVREGSDAVVRVQDSGIGISPDQMARIFEMFAQHWKKHRAGLASAWPWQRR
jgi:signal transduction histidine kinase